MTIRSACYVACNECGEPAEITVEGAAVARRLAARQGFVRFEGHDLCSRHAPSGVEPKEPRERKPNPAERSVSVFDILAEMKASGKENRTFGSKVKGGT